MFDIRYYTKIEILNQDIEANLKRGWVVYDIQKMNMYGYKFKVTYIKLSKLKVES